MRILVADDEPIEREAMRVLVQRQLPDVQVVGEAATGRQAVELTEALRPDVVLMDIEMPGLNGLEALREIRERVPGVRCLIVSAYDYFHFARDALRLGAADYLLKPVGRDQMVEVLRRLERDLEQERQRRQEELRRKEQLHQLQPLAEAELAGRLIRGEAGPETERLLDLLGLRFESGLCMVIGLTEQSFGPEVTAAERAARTRHAYGYLGTLTHSLCRCALGAEQAGTAPLLVELERSEDEYGTRLWSMELARRLRERVKEQTGVRVRIGVGGPGAGPPALGRSYQEALTAWRFEGPSEKVNHYGDLAAQGELSGDAAQPARWRPTPAVLRAVQRGQQFLRQHYAEELSLERVAREVALTPYYYGKIFSKVAGETVVDYLTRVRVEKAKRLLAESALSVKEACYAVGYNDPNYFSRVFKKITGQTPTEFRTGTAE